MTKAEEYRNGGEGFIKWVEDNVYFEVYPDGSDIKVWMPVSEFPLGYKEMWKRQQEEFIIPGLEMTNGKFRYRLLIAMWPRGEGKSVLTKLIQTWRFFCFPSVSIILGANSLGQVRFHHFEEIVKTITNSPKLLVRLGQRNLKQKQIEMRDERDNVTSFIRPVSSFSGIYSGCSGYVFNEFHQATNFKFFTEIDSSMRGVKNGMGLIDTTVSSKMHVLHQLYRTWLKGSDPFLFFSYRTTTGKATQFWNPEISQEYLNSQKERLPFGDYERFFINSWSAGAERVFSDEEIEATNFLGIDQQLNIQKPLIKILTEKNKLIAQEKKIIRRDRDEDNETREPVIASILFEQHADRFKVWDDRLWPVSDVYRLQDAIGKPSMAPMDALEQLSNMYDTDWAILAGGDLADPLKTRTSARTIITVLAKGLIGSRTDPYPTDEALAARYLYFLLHLVDVETHDLKIVKDVLLSAQNMYDGIDTFGVERWGVGDLETWCIDNDITPVLYYPTYGRQRSIFTEVGLAYRNGNFKTPPLVVRGSKEDDILKEEAAVFDHNPDATKSKFGSPEKKDKYGVQDDAMFALGSAFYGGLNLGVDSFRERKGMESFGMFFEDMGLMGDYR